MTNSLSGNSISLTYQSVLQLNLQNQNSIMDGYGNNSQLFVYPISSNNPIKVGTVVYPVSGNVERGRFVTAEENYLTKSLPNLNFDTNHIYYNDIQLDNIPSTSAENILILNNDDYSGFTPKENTVLKYIDHVYNKFNNKDTLLLNNNPKITRIGFITLIPSTASNPIINCSFKYKKSESDETWNTNICSSQLQLKYNNVQKGNLGGFFSGIISLPDNDGVNSITISSTDSNVHFSCTFYEYFK